MSEETNQLGYSLAKRVPSMESGFEIKTNYGNIHIEGHDAKSIINAVRKLLDKKLRKAEKALGISA